MDDLDAGLLLGGLALYFSGFFVEFKKSSYAPGLGPDKQ
jgi:hypothetical protein